MLRIDIEECMSPRDRDSWPRRTQSARANERGGMTLNNQNRLSPELTGADSGSARRNYGRYVELAREAMARGDQIEAENCRQHAEHYFRVMSDLSKR